MVLDPFVNLIENSITYWYWVFIIDPTIHHGQITPAAAHWHPTFKLLPHFGEWKQCKGEGPLLKGKLPTVRQAAYSSVQGKYVGGAIDLRALTILAIGRIVNTSTCCLKHRCKRELGKGAKIKNFQTSVGSRPNEHVPIVRIHNTHPLLWRLFR